jgi:hypothetical protein
MSDSREELEKKKEEEPEKNRRPLFTRTHQKASLSRWVIPLIIILAVIFFLPRVMDLLLPG